MDEEIQKYLKIVLDSGVSSYYRKDAIRHLGRLRKSAELSNAVLKVMNDVDDPSLQREAMDLAAQFAITESVNILLPISVGKGLNARHAINVLAKIGGVKAYKCLREIADAPGFDLSKTAAKRAIEDLLRREPGLTEKEEDEPSLLDDAKSLVSGVTEVIIPGNEEKKQKAPEPKQKPKEPEGNCDQDLHRLKREFGQLQSRYQQLENQLKEKNEKIEALEDKIRHLKGSSEIAKELKELKKQLHESRNETASVKAAYEKQVVLLQGKINSLEEENDDLLKRAKKGIVTHKKSSSGAGCFSFLIFLAVFIYIAYFIFSKVTSSSDRFEDIRDKIRIEHK